MVRGTTTTATYDAQDRLTNYNGVARTYNANGELLTIGSASTTYDVFGNLKQYMNGATNITYEIDPLRRRLGRTVNAVASSRTRYIYNPEGQLVGELNYQNKLIKRFVYATKGHVPDYYIDSSNNKFRIVTDQLGSVRMVVNASTGVVSQYMEHDEFGVVLSDTSPGLTPFGFAGGLYTPQSGLVRFQNRDYDPQTGRWASKDPIRFAAGDSNLYGYVMSDPINFIDPSGLYLIDETGGRIPPEFRYSPEYKKLQGDRTSVTLLRESPAIPTAGLTTHYGNQQLIQVNPYRQNGSLDNIDTYFHEANHAQLNIDYSARTDEFFDTNIMLPFTNQKINKCR